MANTPINAMTATFGAGDHVAIKMNVADSGPSNAGSRLLDLQVGGNSKFKVTKEGYVTATNFTGSFSGSSYVSNAPSYAGTAYPVFTTGITGKQVLKVDNTGLNFAPSTNTLTVGGDLNIGGTLDTDNSTGIIYPSPSGIIVGPNSTQVFIGTTGTSGGASYTNIQTYQVLATSFNGSFTGSISGSKINSRVARFVQLTSSNARFTGRLISTSFTGSISGSLSKFTKLSASNARIGGRVVATSFTGSISGGLAKLNTISGANANFTGRVVATSFTGSISGGLAKLNTISGANANFTGRVVATSFTGSFKATTFNINELSAANAVFSGRVRATSFTGSISGSRAKFYIFSASKAHINTMNLVSIKGTSFTGSVSGSLGKFLNISGGNATITGRVQATSFTGSISGSRARFLRLSSSNARVSGRVVANSFTGSISGGFARLLNISGGNATFSGRVVANSFTGSISGGLARLNRLTASNATISGRVVATSFTGSFKASVFDINQLSASNATIDGRVIANSFTGSISGSKGKFSSLIGTNITGNEISGGNIYGYTATFNNLSLSSITSSIKGNLATFTKLSGSNARISGRVVANSFTGSISGSVYVHDTNLDDNHYITFGDLSRGQTILYTDNNLSYNPNSNKLVTAGDLLVGKNVDSDGDPITVFSSSTEMTFGYNLVNLYLANKSTKVDIGANFTTTYFSGSITSSICRASKISASNAFVSRNMVISGNLSVSGSVTCSFIKINKSININSITSSFISASKGFFGRLTSSKCNFTNITASNLHVSNFISTSYARISNNQNIIGNLNVEGKTSITGSLNLRRPFTGSGLWKKNGTIISSSINGAIPIKIGGITYYIPIYTSFAP